MRIPKRQDELNELAREYLSKPEPEPKRNGRTTPSAVDTGSVDVEKAIDMLRRHPDRREIFDGGDGNYTSLSEADGRMFFNLAFACGGNLDTMEDAARRSGRVRSKWD